MRKAGYLIVSVLGITLGMALQCVMGCALLNLFPGTIYFGMALSCHIAGSLCAAMVYLQLKTVSRYVFFYFSLIFGLMIPVMGIIFTATAFLFRTLCDSQRQNEQDWDVALEENEVVDTTLNEPLDEEEFVMENLDLESFVDILNGTDLNMKRSVIEKLADDDKKDNIILLQKALKDQDPEIRFYASASLKKIEENFQKYLMAIQKELQLKPKAKEQHLLLAKEYFRFARSGMLDQTSTSFYYEQSQKAVEQVLSIDPDNEDGLLTAGKIYLQLEQYDTALKYLNNAYDKNPSNWQTLIWRCEVYFRLNEYEAIQNDCARIATLKTPWDTVQDITQYWTAYA